MEKKFKNWWLVLIKGIILIGMAFWVFRHPVDALVGLAMTIGIGFLIAGIIIIIAAISFRSVSDDWGWRLAEGIIDIVFAIVLINNPAVTAAVIPFVVGFWTIIYGVFFIASSFGFKKEGASDWWVSLLGGIAGVIIGYLITTNPLVGAFTVTSWIGLGFLLLGIVNIVVSLRLKKIAGVLTT